MFGITLLAFDDSSTFDNLGNDHGFINKETLSIGVRPFE